ncbi:MAG: hypothetical protein ACOYJ2_00465 [Rickettsiales bacterium]
MKIELLFSDQTNDNYPDEMNILLNFIKSSNLYPILVHGDIDPETSDGFPFVGSITEYISALKNAGSKNVYVFIELFEETSFLLKNTFCPEEFTADEEDCVDLRKMDSKFKNFVNKIGEVCRFKLSSSLEDVSLDFYYTKDWWFNYVVSVTECVTKLEEAEIEADEESEEIQRNQSRDIIKKISKLANEPQFNKLRTQRAMMAYVLEKIPETSTIPQQMLKMEIQRIFDKIKYGV